MRFSGLSRYARTALAGAALFALACAGSAVGSEAHLGHAPGAPLSGEALNRVKAQFEDVCGNCHDLYVTTDQRKTRDGWATTVGKMIGYGAPLSEAEAGEILDYLSTQYAAAN
jgi:hypothetical protein